MTSSPCPSPPRWPSDDASAAGAGDLGIDPVFYRSIDTTDIKIVVKFYMSSIVCCYSLYCVSVFIPMT